MNDDLIGTGDGRRVKKSDNEQVNSGQLRAFIERIEKLDEEKQAIADDIKDVYVEAKGNGYDPKTIRKLVALRKMDPEKRREQEMILDIYRAAIGFD